VLPHGLLEKAQRGLLVARGGEQEVDGLTLFVDSPVELLPLALDLDVRLVYPPALADRAFLAVPKGSLQRRPRCRKQWHGVSCGHCVIQRMSWNSLRALCDSYDKQATRACIGCYRKLC
jgi:hypothetical protein